MGQAMVAIVEDDCTGCDLCILHCPFEALLPLQVNPPGRKHAKRPVVVLEQTVRGLPVVHWFLSDRCAP